MAAMCQREGVHGLSQPVVDDTYCSQDESRWQTSSWVLFYRPVHNSHLLDSEVSTRLTPVVFEFIFLPLLCYFSSPPPSFLLLPLSPFLMLGCYYFNKIFILLISHPSPRWLLVLVLSQADCDMTCKERIWKATSWKRQYPLVYWMVKNL